MGQRLLQRPAEDHDDKRHESDSPDQLLFDPEMQEQVFRVPRQVLVVTREEPAVFTGTEVSIGDEVQTVGIVHLDPFDLE